MTSVQSVERKLAVILAADVAGYSRLVGADEEAALATLSAYRKIIDARIDEHGGRVFGSAGDSVLAEFPSPVEAVRAAVEMQEQLDGHNAELTEAQRMRFRIGINLGDVIVEDDNLLGDGVNVAARLEGLARPGGLCVSAAVFEQVRDRLALDYHRRRTRTAFPADTRCCAGAAARRTGPARPPASASPSAAVNRPARRAFHRRSDR